MDKKIKKYSIHKLSYKNGYIEREGYGCFIGEGTDNKNIYAFYDKNEGTFLKINLPKEIEVKSTRSISEETRKLLKEAALLYESKEKMERQINELQNDIRKLKNEKIPKLEGKIRSSLGLLSKREFGEAVLKALPKKVRDDFANDDWKIGTTYGISYRQNDLHFSREVDIKKWARGYSFLYEEYDRTLQFCGDYETDESYKKLIDSHRRMLPIRADFEDTLSIGDKDWLSYSAMYSIPLKKDLTKEYAKELAASLIELTKTKKKLSLDDRILQAKQEKNNGKEKHKDLSVENTR